MTKRGLQTELACETCHQVLILKANHVIVAAELEAFLAHHRDCESGLRAEIHVGD